MDAFLLALVLLPLAGLVAWLGGRTPGAARFLGAAGGLAGCALALVAAVAALGARVPPAFRAPWRVPFGALALELDPLSAGFVALIALLAGLASVYAAGYLAGRPAAVIGRAWFFLHLMTASLLLVAAARNAVLFLVGWELMSVAAFFLVTLDDGEERNRRAGRTFLVASQAGAACLLAFFLVCGLHAPTLDFAGLAAVARAPDAVRNWAFLLGLAGFGLKAGLMPLHGWLPEAHPAAPSHVSALMSGIMIKAGVYGLLRMLTWLGAPPAWWAWTLLAVGLGSAVLGLSLSLAQTDLKRSLAYSSVENLGLVAVGLGVGLAGLHAGSGTVALLGFAGAVVHTANHAALKSLLFLAGGAVVHATGTAELSRLGGLLKRMPWTGASALVGAAGVAGLPPFSGFFGELLILLGALHGGLTLPAAQAAPLLAAAAGVALAAALALAGFARFAGIAFLGEPRTAEAAGAHEAGWLMRLPMALLAGLAAAAALYVPALAAWAFTVAPPAARAAAAPDAVAGALHVLRAAGLAATGVALAAAALLLLRRVLLRRRAVGVAVTWDCGYAAPDARMQYTAASFVQPITALFAVLLRPRRRQEPVRGLFPATARHAEETPDVIQRGLVRPLLELAGRLVGRFRWIQHGNVHLYVLYVALTVLALVIWSLASP